MLWNPTAHRGSERGLAVEKREIYISIRKICMILISYVVIAVALSGLVFTQTEQVILKVIGVAIDVVIAAAFVYTARKLVNRKPLFVFDAEGVTDYSKPEDILMLPWTQVTSIGLKAANSNDLMLNIVGYKTADQIDVDSMPPQIKMQLKANDNKAYYAMEVSGLWVARKDIRQTFEMLKEKLPAVNGEIQFVDFEDPLAKLGKKF